MIGNNLTCCLILSNIIVEDEYKVEDCDNNNFLLEDKDQFRVDPV